MTNLPIACHSAAYSYNIPTGTPTLLTGVMLLNSFTVVSPTFQLGCETEGTRGAPQAASSNAGRFFLRSISIPNNGVHLGSAHPFSRSVGATQSEL